MRLCNPSDLEWIEGLSDEGYGDFEDYYPASASGEIEPTDSYYGRNVIWDGIEGRMFRVDPGYVTAIPGNIFDPDKLAAIVSGIQQAHERVVFTAPYGTVTVITPQDVKESIEYEEDDSMDRPLTTGDDDLDQWLVDPEEHIRESGEDAAVVMAEMEEALEDAVQHRSGDLGKIAATIRDGNHRAFGSMIAGEPYIYMIVAENQIQDLDPKDPLDQLIIESLE